MRLILIVFVELFSLKTKIVYISRELIFNKKIVSNKYMYLKYTYK